MNTIIAIIIPFAAAAISYLVYRNNIRKDESGLMLEMMEELAKDSPNKYSVEYLFSKIYKTDSIQFSEIVVLMSHPTPLKAINNLLMVRRNIDAFTLKPGSDGIEVIANTGWENGKAIILKRNLYLLLMIVLYFLAVIFFGLSSGFFLNNDAESLIRTATIDSGISVLISLIVNITAPVICAAGMFHYGKKANSVTLIGPAKIFLENR